MNRYDTNLKHSAVWPWAIPLAGLLLVSLLGCSLTRRLESTILAHNSKEFHVRQVEFAAHAPFPTLTLTFTPSPTLPPTFTPSVTPTPTNTTIPTSTPMPLPPTPTNPPMAMVTATATATLPPNPTSPPQPTATPPPTATSTPSFAYQAREVYTDQTSNPFLTGYIAIVNAQEIPIGDVKTVGNFDPGNLHYESPLSNWFFDVATAPGAGAKTGSVKFEPPGGIQKGTWTIHLEDEGGTHVSDDLTIATDPDNLQWFYVKFQQAGPSAASTPPSVYASIPTPVNVGTPLANSMLTSASAETPIAALAQPAPSSGWSFANVQIINQDSVMVLGNMVNNTGVTQLISDVTGTFYDNQGQVTPGQHDTYDYWPVEVVPSGGQVPFELTAYDIQRAERVELSVVSQPSNQRPRQDFDSLNVTSVDIGGNYCISGNLHNSEGQLQDYLVVVAVIFNDQDKIINFDSDASAHPADVVGDRTFDFEVCLDPSGQDIARYELQAFGQ